MIDDQLDSKYHSRYILFNAFAKFKLRRRAIMYLTATANNILITIPSTWTVTSFQLSPANYLLERL